MHGAFKNFLKVGIVTSGTVGITLFSLSEYQKNAKMTQQLEIRRINPPILDEEHISRKVICYRPSRRGLPNLSVERIADKIVTHNYGHGGSGWTLAPSSAIYVVDLLEKFAPELQKDTPITVIGAGVLGLFTAYTLLGAKYKNITVVAEDFEDLTSHKAGGLLSPVYGGNPEWEKLITTLGLSSYLFYKDVAENKVSGFEGGASIMPAYFPNTKESELDLYVEHKVMKPPKDVILDFGNGTQRKMIAYDDGIFIHTMRLMTHLRNQLEKKVTFVKKKINAFEDIKDKYIINCTGLGAKELNNDPNMVSIQGHLLLLKDQNSSDMQYMIAQDLEKTKNKHGQDILRLFYIFPKINLSASDRDVGVLGGTFVTGATKDTPNTEEFEIMLKNAREFYGIR